jgi:ribonuclease-3
VAAAGISLGKYLRLGRGEMAAGGHLRDSILADALEAVIGAAFLDGGMRSVQKIFRALFIPALHNNLNTAWHDNPKGSLQEWAQQNAQTNPRYHLISQSGPAHAMVFIVETRIGHSVVGQGEGTSKQAAEIASAADAMHHPDRLAAIAEAIGKNADS